MWESREESRQTVELASHHARAYAREIIMTRVWNALQGGLYVFVTEQNQPSPYLSHPDRDLTTADGRRLTIVTPSFMTQQIAQVASERARVRIHLASVNPIDPANAADAWEARCISSFAAGAPEHYELAMSEQGEQIFRYMMPLYVEKTCVHCHGQFGQAEGEMGGGVSVTLPAGPMLRAEMTRIRNSGLVLAVVWFAGLAAGAAGFVWVRAGEKSREELIDRLQEADGRIKTLSGLLPICCSCKNIRKDDGYWQAIENFLGTHADLQFSHGICPKCFKKLYPQFADSITEA